jgi:hypothetical protein
MPTKQPNKQPTNLPASQPTNQWTGHQAFLSLATLISRCDTMPWNTGALLLVISVPCSFVPAGILLG